jgi:hypothetical protein
MDQFDIYLIRTFDFFKVVNFDEGIGFIVECAIFSFILKQEKG